MRKSRFTEEQIIAILREQESGAKTADVCRRHGISDATFYKWKSKYGGLEVSEPRRLKVLETENARLARPGPSRSRGRAARLQHGQAPWQPRPATYARIGAPAMQQEGALRHVGAPRPFLLHRLSQRAHTQNRLHLRVEEERGSCQRTTILSFKYINNSPPNIEIHKHQNGLRGEKTE